MEGACRPLLLRIWPEQLADRGVEPRFAGQLPAPPAGMAGITIVVDKGAWMHDAALAVSAGADKERIGRRSRATLAAVTLVSQAPALHEEAQEMLETALQTR